MRYINIYKQNNTYYILTYYSSYMRKIINILVGAQEDRSLSLDSAPTITHTFTHTCTTIIDSYVKFTI